MTLHPTTYRGWQVHTDPRALWPGGNIVAIHIDYETSLSAEDWPALRGEIDDYEDDLVEARRARERQSLLIRARADAEWAAMVRTDLERERNNADLRRRAAEQWETLPATLNEHAAYRADEARMELERSRGASR